MAGMEQDKHLLEVLKRGWDILLLNQFHDIVPGSCIKPVYEQTDREYREIEETGKKNWTGSFLRLSGNFRWIGTASW